jgi:hypothetical protein
MASARLPPASRIDPLVSKEQEQQLNGCVQFQT